MNKKNGNLFKIISTKQQYEKIHEKIINNLIDLIKKYDLYFFDYKLQNILYQANYGKYKIFFGDLGSMTPCYSQFELVKQIAEEIFTENKDLIENNYLEVSKDLKLIKDDIFKNFLYFLYSPTTSRLQEHNKPYFKSLVLNNKNVYIKHIEVFFRSILYYLDNDLKELFYKALSKKITLINKQIINKQKILFEFVKEKLIITENNTVKFNKDKIIKLLELIKIIYKYKNENKKQQFINKFDNF